MVRDGVTTPEEILRVTKDSSLGEAAEEAAAELVATQAAGKAGG